MSDYQTLLDKVLEYSGRSTQLTDQERKVLAAFEAAEPYQECIRLLEEVEKP